MRKHQGSGRRTRSIASLAALVLALAAIFTVQAEPPFQELPGRPKDSREPWGAFLGKAAHHAIATAYRNTHPNNTAFFNTVSVFEILSQKSLGAPSKLPSDEREIEPDITDVSDWVVFEIKPDHDEGLAEGLVQVRRYVNVLNKTLTAGPYFRLGENFAGSVFVHFGGGLHFWQLTWRTPEPGVTLYRWSRSRNRHKTLGDALAANEWEGISKKELRENEQLVQQAFEAALEGRAPPAEFHGTLWLPTRCPEKKKPFEAYWEAATAEQACRAQ